MRARKPVIFFDNPSLAALEDSIRGAPISQLRLNRRASRSMEYLGIQSIGDLVDRARRGIPSTPIGGQKTAAHIAGALYALAVSTGPRGFVDWLRYADQRRRDQKHHYVHLIQMRPVNARHLHASNPILDSLDEAIRRRPLNTLHLRPRALHALELIGIRTIGEFVDAARSGIANFRLAGRQTIEELREALDALSKSALPNGNLDFIKYAINRNFQILPANNCLELPHHEFPDVFLESLDAAVKSRFGTAGYLVFMAYYRHNSEESTFQRLRKSLGTTRQAITLRKANIVKMLRGALFDDDYTGCCFRFRDTLVAPVRRLNGKLNVPRGSALRHSNFTRAMADILELHSKLELIERPLRAILGLDTVHAVARKFEPIILPRSRGTAAFARAQTKIERFLRSDFPSGLSKGELLDQLRRSGENDITLDEIPTVIHSIPGIEYSSTSKRFRFRVEMLSRLSDQLERVLDERGTPMHRRELTLAVSGFKKRTGSLRYALHVAAAMSRDQRFRAIARSGFWVLSKWNTETGDIAEVAARCLKEAGRALTEAELFALIGARRPVKFSSIMSSLRDDGRFQRVAPRTWKLECADA